jgi:D-psicose/D-tagatose/L-ribulose 3-epimerase
MALRYAVHAYSWTSSWDDRSLWIIDHVKELGFDCIEFPLMELAKFDAAACRRRLEAVGLGAVCSLALSAEHDVTSDDNAVRARGTDYLEACVRATAAVGGDLLSGVIYAGIGILPEVGPRPEHWERAAAALRVAARAGQDVGVAIGIEPVNRYETFLINTCAQALALRAMIDEPNVKIHLDAYHMNIEEEGFYEPTKRAAPHLCHYHLSESHRGIPGTGTVDWDGIYRALAEASYEGLVGLESFVEVAAAMRRATCVWRKIAPDSDTLVREGLAYLKVLERTWYGAAGVGSANPPHP